MVNPQAGYIAYGAAKSSKTFAYNWTIKGTEERHVIVNEESRESKYNVSRS